MTINIFSVYLYWGKLQINTQKIFSFFFFPFKMYIITNKSQKIFFYEYFYNYFYTKIIINCSHVVTRRLSGTDILFNSAISSVFDAILPSIFLSMLTLYKRRNHQC